MNNDNYISATKIKNQFGVSSNTLRRWAEDGKIRCLRPNGTRRIYNSRDIQTFFGIKEELKTRKTVLYSRVSSLHQKEDLERQIKYLQTEYPECKIYKDIGSGLNWKRQGLNSLLEAVYKGDIGTVVVTYKDRLCRFGFELLEWIFKKANVKLVVLGADSKQEDPSRELSEDLLAITTIFVARNNGLRAGKYRRERRDHNEQRESCEKHENKDLPNNDAESNFE